MEDFTLRGIATNATGTKQTAVTKSQKINLQALERRMKNAPLQKWLSYDEK